MRILIVEDDQIISENLSILLSQKKYIVSVVDNAEDAIIEISSNDYDVAIVDWMLGKESGIEVIKEVRSLGSSLPILILTARSNEEDIVFGLESGADDYLVKPFRSGELLARINSLLRRKTSSLIEDIHTIGELRVDTKLRNVYVGGEKIFLSPREYDLLEYLLRNKNEPIERLSLLAHVWGGSIDEMSNTVDVHIRYLRKKMGSASKYIQTVKGIGYRLCAD